MQVPADKGKAADELIVRDVSIRHVLTIADVQNARTEHATQQLSDLLCQVRGRATAAEARPDMQSALPLCSSPPEQATPEASPAAGLPPHRRMLWQPVCILMTKHRLLSSSSTPVRTCIDGKRTALIEK